MHPRKLYVETTTRCNMQCGMCVKQAPGNCISDQHLDPALYQRLAGTLPQLEGLVLNGIGEPLLHPQLLDMVSMAGKLMPPETSRGLQTNGLLLEPDMAERLLAAGLNRLCISVDGLTSANPNGNIFLHQHRQQYSRIAQVREVCTTGGYHNVLLGAEIVLTRETLPQLPELVRRLADEGVDFIIASHLIAYHREAEAQSVFNSATGEAMNIYRKWQTVAAAEGLNIAHLTAKTWIAPRHREEHRLQQIYRLMLAEAGEQAIWLNVKKLARLDAPEHSSWQKYLDEAAVIAGRFGVDISLPPLYATTKRMCRFMEDDAMFIDVNGLVMPCHSLWHTQTLYMDGEVKHLERRVFGSLAEQDVSEIWNNEEYRKFRQEALAYDYPFCHGCSLGPCPDITGETTPFVNDCFGTSVPCGHCLWCYDGIRCL